MLQIYLVNDWLLLLPAARRIFAYMEQKPKRKNSHVGKSAEELAEIRAKTIALMQERPLNAQQLRFVKYYLLHWNGSKAALQAGYAPSSAGQNAYTLLRDPRVIKLLEEERERIRQDYRKTHEALTAFYLRVLEIDPTEIITEVRNEIGDISAVEAALMDKQALTSKRGKQREFNGLPSGNGMLIDSITLNDTKEGQALTVKVFSKQAAADMLNKHVGYYGADNAQKATSGVAIYLPDNGRDDSSAEAADVEEE